jgi:hypothetical protein
MTQHAREKGRADTRALVAGEEVARVRSLGDSEAFAEDTKEDHREKREGVLPLVHVGPPCEEDVQHAPLRGERGGVPHGHHHRIVVGVA